MITCQPLASGAMRAARDAGVTEELLPLEAGATKEGR